MSTVFATTISLMSDHVKSGMARSLSCLIKQTPKSSLPREGASHLTAILTATALNNGG